MVLRVLAALASRRPRRWCSPTFEKARADFEAAWADILPRCTDADFAEHCYPRAFVKRKYQIWSEGHKMPTQTVERHVEVLLRRDHQQKDERRSH
jgi:hypothetical protein